MNAAPLLARRPARSLWAMATALALGAAREAAAGDDPAPGARAEAAPHTAADPADDTAEKASAVKPRPKEGGPRTPPDTGTGEKAPDGPGRDDRGGSGKDAAGSGRTDPAPAPARTDAAPDASRPPRLSPAAIEANKDKDREVLRELRLVPPGTKGDRPNLDEIIGEWSDQGRVVAARIASAKRAVDPGETRTMSLEPLRALTALVHLELIGLAAADLKPLSALPALTELRLIRCSKVTSLSELARLPRLQKLRLDGVAPGLLGVVRNLVTLTELEIVNTDLDSTGFLAGLVDLERLDLGGNRRLVSLKEVANLPALRFLNVAGTGVRNLAQLAALEKLRVLRVSKGADVTPLAKLVEGGLRIEAIEGGKTPGAVRPK